MTRHSKARRTHPGVLALLALANDGPRIRSPLGDDGRLPSNGQLRVLEGDVDVLLPHVRDVERSGHVIRVAVAVEVESAGEVK